MSKQHAEAFLEKASHDLDLKNRLQELENEDSDMIFARLVSIGSDSGFEFTAEEIREAYTSSESKEVEDADLDNVIGGRDIYTLIRSECGENIALR